MVKSIAKSYDYSLIAAIFIISIFGLIMVYSASMVWGPSVYGYESDFFFQKQKLNLLVALAVFLFFAIFPYKAYESKNVLYLIFFGSLGVLSALLILGHTAGNAQSWFKLGARSIQPSEFIKVGVIIYLSAVYAKKQDYLDKFNVGVLPPILFLVFVCGLVALQPDFGTAAIIALIAATVIMSSGIGKKNIMKLFAIAMAVVLIVSPFIYLLKDDIFTENRMGRISSFMDPFEYEQSTGYQVVNGYIAMGTGGLTGTGLGNSVQKYGYLPEPHTDFIMAIIVEELGLIGVIIVFGCLGFIVLKGFWISTKCTNAFGSLLAIGISSMIGIQTFINLGGLTGIIPITGVPLPFVSYGGSSSVLLAIAMGILVNISMFNKYDKKYKSKQTLQYPKEEQQTNYYQQNKYVSRFNSQQM
ncbi:FtsW/RodA/SpoVE family cell cycle protein [Bacillus sp. AGMB 02131]|uniref:Probable peptidoglycan glycosyltransferase FtsW n=1 Tax=Peribacillus faecalis TaxID=2772559 RepID=A0A927CS36_9BACI|nr:FtsW/RodA/SpoVE family cell cycle protein [Peribacillus faecalis]MBD3106862.1 FtsW/RodA/SpoVE family cell cycle protein [Peribacillus faecalis]